MMLFAVLDRIGDGANHILTSDELIRLAKEVAFSPCTAIAKFREGEHEDQIEIIVRFKHQGLHEKQR